jgi:hypothetical protein
METLNTPDEIALWISTAAGHMSTARGAYPPTAANMADAMVLELRKRIPAAGLSGEPDVKMDPPGLDARLQAAQNAGKRVRVTFANDDVSEGTVKRLADDYWTLDTDEHFGTDAGFHDAERAVKIEFLSTPADLNEQLRLAAERGQCVRVTLAGDCGYAEGHVTWRPDFSTDTMPAKVGTHWCGANEPEDSYRVISVEILDA